jgi:hypothetical protein
VHAQQTKTNGLQTVVHVIVWSIGQRVIIDSFGIET